MGSSSGGGGVPRLPPVTTKGLPPWLGGGRGGISDPVVNELTIATQNLGGENLPGGPGGRPADLKFASMLDPTTGGLKAPYQAKWTDASFTKMQHDPTFYSANKSLLQEKSKSLLDEAMVGNRASASGAMNNAAMYGGLSGGAAGRIMGNSQAADANAASAASKNMLEGDLNLRLADASMRQGIDQFNTSGLNQNAQFNAAGANQVNQINATGAGGALNQDNSNLLQKYGIDMTGWAANKQGDAITRSGGKK